MSLKESQEEFFNLSFLFHILKYILLFIRDYSEIDPI